jgi:hypothetical protein
MFWALAIDRPPLAVNSWLTVSAPLLVVVTPALPIVMALALPVPRDMVPVLPVLLPTSIDTLPEAKAPEVTLPEAIVMVLVALPEWLAVLSEVAPSPCKLRPPEVVLKLEAALPVRVRAPPVMVAPALPVSRLLKVLAPARVWIPVDTRPGKEPSAVCR